MRTGEDSRRTGKPGPKPSVQERGFPGWYSSWMSCSGERYFRCSRGTCLAWGGGRHHHGPQFGILGVFSTGSPKPCCFCCPTLFPPFPAVVTELTIPRVLPSFAITLSKQAEEDLILLESDVKTIFRFSRERKYVVCLHLSLLTKKKKKKDSLKTKKR